MISVRHMHVFQHIMRFYPLERFCSKPSAKFRRAYGFLWQSWHLPFFLFEGFTPLISSKWQFRLCVQQSARHSATIWPHPRWKLNEFVCFLRHTLWLASLASCKDKLLWWPFFCSSRPGSSPSFIWTVYRFRKSCKNFAFQFSRSKNFVTGYCFFLLVIVNFLLLDIAYDNRVSRFVKRTCCFLGSITFRQQRVFVQNIVENHSIRFESFVSFVYLHVTISILLQMRIQYCLRQKRFLAG